VEDFDRIGVEHWLHATTIPTPERQAKGDTEVVESERGGREIRSYQFGL
jgi:hypothetical protein